MPANRQFGPAVVSLPPGEGTPALDRISLTFIGNATTLIRFGDLVILTDPNFLHHGDKAHIGYGLTTTRRTDPAMELDALPPLDLVLLSHLHEDHFDRIVAHRLDRELPIVSTEQAAAALRGKGFMDTRPLRTWQQIEFNKGDAAVRITALPGRHAPAPLLPFFPPVMGSLIDFSDARRQRLRLYISGDTLVFPALKQIRLRYPGIDLALLHLGGTRVFGLTLTMTGAEGVRLLRIVAPRLAVPVHYDDYDAFKSGLEDFRAAVERAGAERAVRYIAPGETTTFMLNGA